MCRVVRCDASASPQMEQTSRGMAALAIERILLPHAPNPPQECIARYEKLAAECEARGLADVGKLAKARGDDAEGRRARGQRPLQEAGGQPLPLAALCAFLAPAFSARVLRPSHAGPHVPLRPPLRVGRGGVSFAVETMRCPQRPVLHAPSLP